MTNRYHEAMRLPRIPAPLKTKQTETEIKPNREYLYCSLASLPLYFPQEQCVLNYATGQNPKRKRWFQTVNESG